MTSEQLAALHSPRGAPIVSVKAFTVPLLIAWATTRIANLDDSRVSAR